MWYLELHERDRLLFRLRLPAAGLRLGRDVDCDFQIPGLAERVKIEPARREVWLTRGSRPVETVTADEPVPLDDVYTLVASQRDAEPIRTGSSPNPKTMCYDGETQLLITTDFLLAIVKGPDAPRDLPLDKDVVIVGRHSGCDLVLRDNYVSGRHLRLQQNAEGWLIVDLGSRNGIFLDDLRIVSAQWPEGATLRLGQTELRLRRHASQAPVPPVESIVFAGMVGVSPEMRRIFGLIAQVAATDATVLIEGPTGSGKELAARALHGVGHRANGPFVAVNCGSMVRELVASELFGHVRGAFTGAAADRAGLFVLANGGTVFLDEIAEMPLDLQPNLLRVLEDRSLRPVGGSRDILVDVRVIAATHRNLAADVTAGLFREDLFYRLEMISIILPPLCARLDDLPLLAEHLLEREARRLRRATAPRLSPEALEALREHSWPGNVRELANVLARAMVLAGDREQLEAADLLVRPSPAGPEITLAKTEKATIERALATSSTRGLAAKQLGIAVSTLYAKMKLYGLR